MRALYVMDGQCSSTSCARQLVHTLSATFFRLGYYPSLFCETRHSGPRYTIRHQSDSYGSIEFQKRFPPQLGIHHPSGVGFNPTRTQACLHRPLLWTVRRWTVRAEEKVNGSWRVAGRALYVGF